MAHSSTFLNRVRDTVKYYVGGVWRLLNEKQVFLWAQAIAFKVLVTVVPVVVLGTGVLGLVLKREQAFATVATFIRNFLPPSQGNQILEFLRVLGSAGGTITVIGVLGLLLSVITLFTTLRLVVANAFHEEWHRQRGVWQGYVFDLRMTVQVGLLFLLTVALSLGMHWLGTAGTTWLGEVGLGWVRESWGRLFAIFGLLLPFMLSVAMFFQLYYFVPRPHPPVRSALTGAAVTAMLWELAKYGFAFYAAHAGQFDYGASSADEGLRALGSTFGLLLAFVFWVYYSGVVLTIGAFIGLLSEKRIRSRRKHEHLDRLRGKRNIQAAASIIIVLVSIAAAGTARAQHPLILVNEETRVRGLGFEFAGSQSFEDTQLRNQIATRAPGFWDRVYKWLPLLEPGVYPFDPVELQRDVIRLRRFYENNGFLHANIDYANSRLDTTSNTIRVIFSVNEGPPVIIQDIGYYGPGGSYAYYLFDGEQREVWTRFQESNTVHTGERYTDFDRIRIQDNVLGWLKNNGFAFATVRGDVAIDSVANTADIRFLLDPGPIAHYDSIQVEGNESVSENVILRELPFKVGDRFSNKRLAAGQRELFALTLFRSALTDVPPQPRDSTVTVRVRVRESKLRYVNAQTGYDGQTGIGLQGQWTHRNFMGGARTFTASLITQTGFLATPGGGRVPPSLYRGSLTLRQPYFLINRLSAVFSPFVQFQQDPNITVSNALLRLNNAELGNTTTLLYEIYPFRTVSLQHMFSQAVQIVPSENLHDRRRDYYKRSIINISSTLGKVNDFFNPSRGYLLRPFAESGGAILGSDVQYFRMGTDATFYTHLLSGFTGAFRVNMGQFWAQGSTRRQLLSDLSTADSTILENRLDPVMFYAGGSNDVRGWGQGLAGKKTVRADPYTNARGNPDTLFVFEPLGGNAKLAFNIELRSRFPGLGSNWRLATFMDTGALGNSFGTFDTWRTGVGSGIRYQTPIGFIRVDIAYKVNPDDEDLRTPHAMYNYYREKRLNPAAALPDPNPWYRLALHFSIGQAF